MSDGYYYHLIFFFNTHVFSNIQTSVFSVKVTFQHSPDGVSILVHFPFFFTFQDVNLLSNGKWVSVSVKP